MNPESIPNVVISTIIATVGRSTLARAVESVLSQDCSIDFEVIVVNDSGKPLPVEAWHHSARVTILNTNRRERCVARNAGAAIARGKYLHFLDDDDWILPNSFRELLIVARGSNASIVYGATRVVDRDGKLLAEHHIGVDGNALVHVVCGELLPLLSNLFDSKSFFMVGGFDSRFVGAEDWDIGRRVALLGEVVNTNFPVACLVRDQENTTTDYSRARVFNKVSADLILDEKGSFSRMLASAKDHYWRGKMARAYLRGAAWNLKHRKFLKAGNRAAKATVIVFSASHVFSLAFWKSVHQDHNLRLDP